MNRSEQVSDQRGTVISRKGNTLESYIEVKRTERKRNIQSRQNRTARYREKINSLVIA